MGKSILLALILSVVAVSTVDAQIPPGFEVVDIRSGDVFHHRPRINNCGQIVFYIGTVGNEREVFLWDNGALVQVTDNDLPDWVPDINDAGVIAWVRGDDLKGNGEIMILQDGKVTSLGEGSGPDVNNVLHLGWDVVDAQTCAFEADVFFYDGVSVEQITDDGLSNQSVSLNDNDGMAWMRTDFCAPGWWVSDIMHYSDGVIAELPSATTHPVSPDINNVGQVAWGWGGSEGIELWQDGTTTLLTDWGDTPALNDVGDIALRRKLDSYSYWQVWLYRDGVYYQITDSSSFHNKLLDINNAGEIAWGWNYEALHPAGVRLLRRTRSGEADFDEDIDLDDFAVLQECMTGPVDTDRLCECRFLDLDHDRDVDLADFAAFQNLYTGEN